MNICILPEHAFLLDQFEEAPAKLCASAISPFTAHSQKLYQRGTDRYMVWVMLHILQNLHDVHEK